MDIAQIHAYDVMQVPHHGDETCSHTSNTISHHITQKTAENPDETRGARKNKTATNDNMHIDTYS